MYTRLEVVAAAVVEIDAVDHDEPAGADGLTTRVACSRGASLQTCRRI